MTKRNQTIISEFLLLGLPIQPRASKSVLRSVPGHVCYHRPGEPSHPRPHLPGPPPTHPCICFSATCLSLTSASATMPKLLQNMKSQVQSIPYAGCLAQMYFYLFFGVLESFLLCHGLWLLCGHLLPCTTPPSWAPGCVSPAGAVLGADHCPCHVAHPAHGQAVLLCWQCDSSLFLWHFYFVEGVLLWYLSQWVGDSFHGRTHSCDPISIHHYVLCMNFLLHPQSSFCQGYPQGLLHLWLPLSMVSLFLWDNHWSLLVPIN